MKRRASPSLRTLLVDFVENTVNVQVETSDLDVSDAALLHRDPQAERSRLVTRGFRSGAVRSWWTNDELQELVARVVLFRMADETSASLAVADSWSELHAADARFEQTPSGRVGLVSEARIDDETVWTAMSFAYYGDITAAMFGCARSKKEALGRCLGVIDAHLLTLR